MNKSDRDSTWNTKRKNLDMNKGKTGMRSQLSFGSQQQLESVTRVSNLSLQEDGPGKVMIYFHANAEDLGMCYYMLDCLKERLGVRVLAMEYPGYGLHGYNEKDSEKLQKDALTAYDFVNQALKV